MAERKAGVRIPSVDGKTQLFAQLARVDISVPSASKQRNRAKERWTLCRLISTTAKNDLLDCPLSVTIYDDNVSPDCLIETSAGKIGVEATTTPFVEYLDSLKEADERSPDGFWLEASPNGTRYVPSEGEGACELQLPPLKDDLERLWAEYVWKAATDKTRKLNTNEYEKFSQNWLAIYANYPFPRINLDIAVEQCCELLMDLWRASPSFDLIFVEDGPEIVCLSRGRVERMTLNDLWTGAEPVMALPAEAF